MMDFLIDKKNDNENEKYNWVDTSDIFSNGFSRITKHLYLPTMLGLIFGIILTYLIAVYYPTDKFNIIYFDGLWQSILSETKGQSGFSFQGDYISTKKGLEFFTNKVLDNILILGFIFFISIISIGGLTLFIKIKLSYKFSSKYLEDQFIKGTNILTEKELTKKQSEDNIEGIHIGNTAKLDNELENSHTFISGSSGTGKTVLLNQIYREQKKKEKNGRWIIHDTKGDWIEKFYNPKTDYIFNFSDERSINLNIFSFIKLKTDISAVISSIIPTNPNEKDPIWTNTARDILEGCILYCLKNDKKNNLEIKRLIKLSPEKLAEELKDVKGAEIAVGHLTSSETQAGNFMSNFRSKAEFFTTLPDTESEKEINIEDWLDAKDEGQSTIFLLNDTKNKDLNAIRISVFVDAMIGIFLSMSESKKRKVYFLLDEIGSLKKMNKIVDGLALLRSYGGSFFIGIQEIQRLYEIYGKELTSTIVNNTSTKVILRAGETETQEFCSKLIGETKFTSTNMTNSTGSEIGANREGSNFSTSEKTEKAILASEIGNMENNTYYYKNGAYDWTFIKKEFTDEDTYIKTQKAFIPRSDLSIDNLFEKKEKEEIKDELSNSTEEEIKDELNEINELNDKTVDLNKVEW